MPSIEVIKQQFVFHEESSVLIPDTVFIPLPEPEEKEQAAQDEQADTFVPAEELFTEEDAAALREECLEAARADAEQILKQARGEAVQIRERAAREGYAAGAVQKANEIQDCIHGVNSRMGDMQQGLEEFIAGYESGLAGLAVEIARKVIGKRLEQDELELSELVRRAVNSVRKAEWIRVEVSEQLPKLIEYLQRELNQSESGGRVEYAARELPPGSCIVELPDGIIDASVDSQLDNIRQEFDILRSAGEPS